MANLARQEGAPARIALYKSAGRKAAGDGDESATRVTHFDSACEKEYFEVEAEMKYWETFFVTVGAGLFVGVVITPESWFAVPLGIMATMLGYVLHRWRLEANNEHRND